MNLMGMKAENIAYFNNKLILKMLLEEPLSSFELEGKTGLSHMATGRILRRLYEMGIVRPYMDPRKKRSAGRPLFKYEINAEKVYFVCINFQQSRESFTIYDLKGNVVYTETLKAGIIDESVLTDIIERVKKALVDKDLPSEQISIVSVSIPGRINEESGEIIVSSKVDNNLNLFRKFRESFPSSMIEIKNNVDYACINSIMTGEFDYGKGTHLYIYVGVGVACCFIYDKKIIVGSNGFSGEIGMNCIDPDENTLHTAICAPEMRKYCQEVTGDKDFSMDSIKSASEKYPEIRNKLIESADILGRNIRNYVDMLGVSHIVFGGPITNYPDFFFDEFLRVLKKTNYSDGLEYKLDFSFAEETERGQMFLARLNSLDLLLKQY